MKKIIVTSVFIFLLTTPILAEGQEGLVIMLDGFLFFVIFSIFIGLTFVSIKSIKRKTELNKTHKFLIWTIILLFALFTWSMLKTDSRPFEGPIDSIIHRDIIEQLNKIDEPIIIKEPTDSTIQEIITSADTNEIGVYIYLNHQKHFVRKFVSGQRTRKQLDSLTMAIVRKWPKK